METRRVPARHRDDLGNDHDKDVALIVFDTICYPFRRKRAPSYECKQWDYYGGGDANNQDGRYRRAATNAVVDDEDKSSSVVFIVTRCPFSFCYAVAARLRMSTIN